MEHRIQIESCWTDALSAQLKNDYLSIANAVFGAFATEGYYKAKYEDNIFGASLITVIYVDGQPAGTDVMWRNDLDGEKAYQTVDTCVLEKYRGMGLFKRMTLWELDLLGGNTPAYGFPNVNSFPGYVKMGWQVERLYKRLTLLIEAKPCLEIIGGDYARWWLKAQQGISHIHKKGIYYLIRKRENHPVATVIGRVDETTALLFPKQEKACLFKCFGTKSSIYNKNCSIPLVCNQPAMAIPYWKIDAI